jgi:hypothetical protein
VTSGAVRPVFDTTHGHPADAVVGYDVVHSITTPGAALRITVEQVVVGAGNYTEALLAARAFRTERGHYGYTANRWSCGCRWIATILDAGAEAGRGIVFTDASQPAA